MVEVTAEEDRSLVDAQVEFGQPQACRDFAQDPVARIVQVLKSPAKIIGPRCAGERVGQRLELAAIHVERKLEGDGMNVDDRERFPRAGARCRPPCRR